MSNYGTGVAQGVESFHVKHSTRHQSLAHSEATQTYNLRYQGIGHGWLFQNDLGEGERQQYSDSDTLEATFHQESTTATGEACLLRF